MTYFIEHSPAFVWGNKSPSIDTEPGERVMVINFADWRSVEFDSKIKVVEKYSIDRNIETTFEH